MRKSFTRFVLLTLLALLPVAALVTLYVVADPYHVVHRYRGYAYAPGDTVTLTVNAGYVAVEGLRYHDPERRRNAFIFGSSMSQNFKAAEWSRYLPATAAIYHMDASCETLEGIVNKLRYLRREGWQVRHALIVLEEEALHRVPDENSVLYVEHPAVSPRVTRAHFHELFFNAMRNPTTLGYMVAPRCYVDRMLSERLASADVPDRIEPINESYYGRIDSLIAVDPDAFFTPARIASRVYHILPAPQPSGTEGRNETLLLEMAALLRDAGTDYHIIVPPRYLRPELDPLDLARLQRIFGTARVHDFSHDRALTADQRCYYDQDAHLISALCTRLLHDTYTTLHR